MDPKDTGKNAETQHPWTKRLHRLTLPEYEETLRYWVEQHPDRLIVEKKTESVEGLPVFLVKATDLTVPDDDKQVILFTNLHGGPERSSVNTTLRLIEWLIGGSPEANEVLRKQIVLVMPIVNPYSFFISDRFGTSRGVELYYGGDWDSRSLTSPAIEESPELAAVISVIDEYQPEVHSEWHGTGLQEFTDAQLGDRTLYDTQTMFDSTGYSYGNYLIRPWDSRVVEIMVSAGQEAGFPSDRAEADAQQTLWTEAFEPLARRTWLGRPRFHTIHYGYFKYHTMIMTSEVGCEASGVARIRGLLSIGNRPWIDEVHSGYPVNRVAAQFNRFITTYGKTAAERRRSRGELWLQQETFGRASLQPGADGREALFCAVTPRAAKCFDRNRDKFLENIRTFPGIDIEAFERYVLDGPEVYLSVAIGDGTESSVIDKLVRGGQKAPQSGLSGSTVESAMIKNGIGFRLRLPFGEIDNLEVRLNGHLLDENFDDGYKAWFADGYMQVQVNVPPDKAGAMELFLVTCSYSPRHRRPYGFEPPAEVMRRMKSRGETN